MDHGNPLGASAGAAIQVSCLTKRFAGRVALDRVSLRVSAGEVVVLLGANGAGKSTLLRSLAGILLADEGWARVGGWDVVRQRRRAAAATGVALVGEDGWYRRLTGRQNLEFYARLRGMTAAETRSAAASGLADMRLVDHAGQAVGAYSTGMRARLALARARLGHPEVLLLDEPTAGLDARSAAEFAEHLRRPSPQAVLMTAHCASAATDVADRVVVLAGGRVVHDAAAPAGPADLRRLIEDA